MVFSGLSNQQLNGLFFGKRGHIQQAWRWVKLHAMGLCGLVFALTFVGHALA
jgi:hypothetical protein